jgi:hypothetical protein
MKSYFLCALLVVALLTLAHSGQTFISIYWCVSFWALFGIDFYVSQIVRNGEQEATASGSLVDRFFVYLFVAPLILPVRAYRLFQQYRPAVTA